MRSVLVFICTASVATADCAHFKPLDDLALEMRLVGMGQVQVDDATARRVAYYARRVGPEELGKIALRLEGMNLSSEFGSVARLADYSAELLHTGRITDRAALLRNVQRIEGLLRTACGTGPPPELPEIMEKASWTKKLNSILEDDNRTIKSTLLLLLLFGMIGLAFVLKYVIAYGVGFIHHKKTCLVPAELHAGDHVFAGHISRAGLNGVRFEYDSAATAKRLTMLLASPEFIRFSLWVDKDSWPVFVDGYHGFFSPLYFISRIRRGDLNKIVQLSTRAVHPAPSIGHKSTRRKWHKQITKRRDEMSN